MKQKEKQVKRYDAGDLLDAHALAESRLVWLLSLVSTIKQNFECGRNYHNQELLEVTQYLAEGFVQDHKKKSDEFEAEYNINN